MCKPSCTALHRQAKIRALPQEWWTDSHQRVHNAMVEGRQDNLDKFKPGVGGM